MTVHDIALTEDDDILIRISTPGGVFGVRLASMPQGIRIHHTRMGELLIRPTLAQGVDIYPPPQTVVFSTAATDEEE